MSNAGKKYGTEYSTVLKAGNIKFIVQTSGKSAKTPMETMTKGRVYVLVNEKFNQPVSITYHDSKNKRCKQIDLLHIHNGKKPHAHIGYFHDEHGTRNLTPKEKKFIDNILKIWYSKNKPSVV